MTDLGYHCNRLRHIEQRLVPYDLKRGEFFHFPEEELPGLQAAIRENEYLVSIHAPLLRPEWYPDPPTWAFLCDEDMDKRQLNLKMIEATLEMAPDYGAEYVVVHFPAPMSKPAPWLSYERQQDIALESADRLAELSVRYKIPLHIEGFGPSPFLNVEFLGQVMREFDVLRYCFDVAHLHLAAQRDGFDYSDFAEGIAPHLGSVHLWNVRTMDDYRAYRHIPVHPSQKPEEGWVDIPHILGILKRGRPSIPVILESARDYPEALGGLDSREGVQWVKELLATSY